MIVKVLLSVRNCLPTGFFIPVTSTAALLRIMAAESEGIPVKSFPSSILMLIVFVKSTSVAKPEKRILRLAGLPSQSGAGCFHQIAVIGEEERVTELINLVLSNSFFITV